MVSIVIRNKNESAALDNILTILNKVYSNDISEIIVVDNNSSDDSIKIAEKHNCKVVTINDFSYGRATNLGIERATSNYILLLSSHAIPIGNSFFKNSLLAINMNTNIAGIRYVSGIEDYKRALKNNFSVKDPLSYGLMTGCALINKEVWLNFKFNENLPFSEDKEWSSRVFEKGYEILELNETFYYFIKRDEKSALKRYINESVAKYLLFNVKQPSKFAIYSNFFAKIFFANNLNYLKKIKKDFLYLKANIQINNIVNNDKSLY